MLNGVPVESWPIEPFPQQRKSSISALMATLVMTTN